MLEQVVFRLVPTGREIFRLKCRTCGSAFDTKDDWRKFCSPGCYRAPGTPGVGAVKPVEPLQYRDGELTDHAMTLLLRRWKRQKRECIYCGRPANSVEHIIPRARGGTNREGNLAPACKSCNSRKGSLLVIEFRAGRMSAQHQRFAEYSASKRAGIRSSRRS